jgi:hypothetical protein
MAAHEGMVSREFLSGGGSVFASGFGTWFQLKATTIQTLTFFIYKRGFQSPGFIRL